MAATGLPPAIDADLARVTESIRMISPKWNARLLLTLSARPLRYTEIKDKLPWLHDGQLHPKIRTLCDTGLAERTAHSPRHVTYGLTDRGTVLLPVLTVIAAWGKKHLEQPDTPVSAIEHIEDSLALLTPRHAPAVLWVLKTRGEVSARALASIVTPDGFWTSMYTPLKQLVDDGLVETARGKPYRLTEAGHALGGVFGALSAWAAGRPLSHARTHPIWGQPQTNLRTPPSSWVSHQSRLPAPAPALTTRPAPAAQRQSGDLFSHATPARPLEALPAGGHRR